MSTKEENTAEIDEKLRQIDQQFDEYVSNLKKTPYTEGWPEDKWHEEIQKHPFFMTKAPEGGEELPPLVEGLQQLKYDENENTPEELATTYKDEGNLNYKCKKYRKAIINYEEGLKQNCSDDLKAQLHNNCAAAHFFLGNYRSAIQHCERAIQLNPDYIKAKLRLAQCLLHLEKYDECITMCDKVLSEDVSNAGASSIRLQAVKKQKLYELNLRKKKLEEKRTKENEEKLLNKIREKNIKISPSGVLNDVSQLKRDSPFGKTPEVHLDGETLVWPVTFLFPEHHIVELVENFYETTTFEEQLNEMFNGEEQQPPWDVDCKYKVDKLRVYYSDGENSFRVNLEQTLENVLRCDNFLVCGGTPSFSVFVANTEAEKQFLENPVYPKKQ